MAKIEKRGWFRSAYIALLGTLIQAGIGAIMFLLARQGKGIGAFVIGIIGVYLLIGSAFGIIPTILLFFKSIIRFSGVISLLFGIAGLILKISSQGNLILGFPGLGSLVGIFLIIAGIIAVWKKI